MRILVWPIALVAMSAGDLHAEPGEEARAGLEVLDERGCLGCHSTDGTARVGPTLLGLFGSRVELGRGSAVVVDDDYVRRAIRQPDAELRTGYPARTMPMLELDGEEVEQVVAAVRHLGDPEVVADRQRDEGTLWMLIAGAALFVLGHLVMSAHPVRGRLVGRLGAGGFQGLYSLVALVGFVLLVWGWVRAPYVAVWTPPLWTRHVTIALMPLAMVFIAGAVLHKSPTAVGQEGALEQRPAPRGLQTITRHPMLWGFALWGLAHVPPNGDVATLILIGSVVVLSVAGMVHIDRRRARDQGEDWRRYAEQTSVVPMAAVLRGRTRLHGRGLIVPLLVGLFAFAGFAALHELLIGVSAKPY